MRPIPEEILKPFDAIMEKKSVPKKMKTSIQPQHGTAELLRASILSAR